MSRKCILCGNRSMEVSYHVFPKDPVIRQKWTDFCVSDPEKCEKDLSICTRYLCSTHFVADNYLRIMGATKNLLKREAVPSIHCENARKRNHTETEELRNYSCASKLVKTETGEEKPLKIECVVEGSAETSEIMFEDCADTKEFVKDSCPFELVRTDTETDKPPKIEYVLDRRAETPDTKFIRANNTPSANEYPSTPPSSQIHSPLGNNLISSSISEASNLSEDSNFEVATTYTTTSDERTSAEPEDKVPFFKEPRYVGDIKSSHIATPQGAKKALALARIKIAKQRAKIVSLQQANRRLKKRIAAMKEFVPQLKDKQKFSN